MSGNEPGGSQGAKGSGGPGRHAPGKTGPGGGIRRLVHCSLPADLVRRPVLHGLAHASGAVVNIHRANVDVEAGVAWFLLELEGAPAEVERAEAWLQAQGVTVERIEERPR